jgi:hypothetical protein
MNEMTLIRRLGFVFMSSILFLLKSGLIHLLFICLSYLILKYVYNIEENILLWSVTLHFVSNLLCTSVIEARRLLKHHMEKE